jgi:signal transduction histidine kinase
VEVSTPEGELDVPGAHATALFRCFQELLTNVARHARATRVFARLERSDDTMVLEVEDNGRGITLEEASSHTSLGLLGIRERAAMLGGQLEVKGQEGGGTTVTVSLPSPPEERGGHEDSPGR